MNRITYAIFWLFVKLFGAPGTDSTTVVGERGPEYITPLVGGSASMESGRAVLLAIKDIPDSSEVPTEEYDGRLDGDDREAAGSYWADHVHATLKETP
jgi:hypothetical protein